MTIFLNRQQYYLFLLIISCYLFLFVNADNDTDHHSNETIEEFNTTFISLTTIDNKLDNNKNVLILIDDVSSSATFTDSTLLSTSVSLETITDGNLAESNTTFNEDNDLTTIKLTQINETRDASTIKSEVQTTIAANTSCVLSKHNITEKNGTTITGCNNATMNVSISSSTVTFNNETELISTIDNGNMTMTTEKNDASSETSTENTTFITNENTATESDMNSSTTQELENTTTEESTITTTTEESEITTTTEELEITTTTEESEITTTTEESASTTTKNLENTTTKLIETTTQTYTKSVKSMSCVDSEFECCPNGKTSAKGPRFEGCNTTEKWISPMTKQSLQTVCELEKEAGSCSKYVNMWAYDRQQGKCIRFWYGSCEGNGNRFETDQQCQETCISPKGIEVCLLPKITGPCHAASNRYYYDRDKKECQLFHYGGCNGNANNYESIEKCQSTCVKETVGKDLI
ncbi:unnamed protein product [Rotaria sp. Silwood1]|nr:unnamed protein product [Rotaria sp. Silwood1]